MQRYILNKHAKEREHVKANTHAFIDRLPASRSWRIEIMEHHNARTLRQNNALFGVAYPPLVEATGHTPDELHYAFCCKAFGTIEVEVLGEIERRPARTTTTDESGRRDVLSADRFADFYRMVQQVGAELGVDVPDPDPFYREVA